MKQEEPKNPGFGAGVSEKFKDAGNYLVQPGFYQLHLLIQQSIGLFVEDGEVALDPIFEIKVFGKKQFSRVKNRVGKENIVWNEDFFFQKQYKDRQEPEVDSIVISLFDHKRLLSDSLIGRCEFSINRVYSSKEHSLINQWVALANAERDFSSVMGYVQLSLSLTGEKDPQVIFKEQPQSSDLKPILPPQIIRKTFVLSAVVYFGDSIVKTDIIGSVDPYVQVECMGQTVRSKHISDNVNPDWQQELTLPLVLPSVMQRVVIKLFDYNGIGSNELIGITSIPVQVLETSKKLQPKWYNIYGPQNKCSSQQKMIYATYPHLATYFCGAIMMSFELKDCDEPVLQSKQIPTEKRIARPPKQSKLRVLFDMYMGVNLPEKEGSFRVGVRIGGKEVCTDKKKAVNGNINFNQCLEVTFYFYDNQQIPDAYVYLVNDSDQRISFYRQKLVPESTIEPAFRQMTADKGCVKLPDERAGLLKFGCSSTRTVYEEKDRTAPITKRLKKLQFKSGMMIAQLYQCRNLTPCDDDGTSDPFCVISYLNSSARSNVVKCTLNPVFNQRIVFHRMEVPEAKDSPPIVIQVYDKDPIGEDFIGLGLVDVQAGKKEGCIRFDTTEPVPVWVPIYSARLKAGQVLVNFMFREDVAESIPETISLPCEKYKLRIQALGLRKLKGSGLFPVRRAYIEFDMKSLALLTGQSNREPIRTEPKQGGPDPNICSIISEEVLLPRDKRLWPNLSCLVYDYVIQGIYEPCLGYLAIDLGYYYNQCLIRKKDNQEMPIQKAERRYSVKSFDQIDKKVLTALVAFIKEKTSPELIKITGSLDLKRMKQQPFDPKLFALRPNYKVNKNLRTFKQKHTQKLRTTFEGSAYEYIPLGYDMVEGLVADEQKTSRHYRFVLPDRIQNFTSLISQMPFETLTLNRGKRFANNSFSDNLRETIDNDTTVGYLKACVKVVDAGVEELQSDLQREQQLGELFLNKRKVKVYLYIIDAVNLARKDQDSNSDPYLIVNFGDHKYDYREQYQNDEPNPSFFKTIQFQTMVPRNTQLSIEVWDFDSFFDADDLIGRTTIDIESRFFDKHLMSIPNKPIETHKLFNNLCKLPQGLLRLWLDVIPIEDVPRYRKFNIGARPKQQFQIRVVVWQCNGMPNNDVEDMSDLFVIGIYGNTEKQTDTHFRSDDGHGEFNWRMKFNVTLPTKDTRLRLYCYDKDLLTRNDFLASGELNLAPYLIEAFDNNKQTTLYLGNPTDFIDNPVQNTGYRRINGLKYFDKFKLPMKQSNADEQDDQACNVVLSVTILPKTIADTKPNGEGRSEPNQYPQLPEPKGRFAFTINPFKMIAQICGPRFRHQILCLFCCSFVLGVIYAYFQALLGSFTALKITN